jgi:glycosyltransferase involved in cell wall biosynthesis
VCFSGVDWDYNRQRPQWLMSELADRGARVLYLDNLGVRLPRPSDAGRVRRRVGQWARTSVRRSVPVSPRINRDAPIVLPLDRPALLRGMLARGLARRIRRRVGTARPLIVWTYTPVPLVADASRDLGADLLVYDWADDAAEHVLFASAARRRRIAGWEEAMLRRADVVFVASGELLRRRGSPNRRTYLVPHGWPPPAEPAPAVLPELEAIPRPRIGFVGTISEWVDLDLLATLARARPRWSFVLVGPRRARLNGLRALPNVAVLGPRRHEQVSSVLTALDVALIPYRVVPATASASPVKLGEYLAHGLPVVSSDLPEVRAFVPPVRIAEGPEGFLEAIDGALAGGSGAPPAAAPWSERVDEMVEHIEEALRAPSG